jgi:hypothetical protein
MRHRRPPAHLRQERTKDASRRATRGMGEVGSLSAGPSRVQEVGRSLALRRRRAIGDHVAVERCWPGWRTRGTRPARRERPAEQCSEHLRNLLGLALAKRHDAEPPADEGGADDADPGQPGCAHHDDFRTGQQTLQDPPCARRGCCCRVPATTRDVPPPKRRLAGRCLSQSCSPYTGGNHHRDYTRSGHAHHECRRPPQKSG